jgi:hypothetical protein
MSNNDSDNKTQQIMLDLFAKTLKTVKGGVMDIDMKGKSLLRIEIDKKREKINLDFIHQTISKWQKLKAEARQAHLIN